MDEYITKPIETTELRYVLNKFLSSKAIEVSDEPQASEEVVTLTPEVQEPEKVTEAVVEDVPKQEEAKTILIAKKFLIEKRILEKVLNNLNYDYTVLEDFNNLETELASNKYDVVLADESLITDEIRDIYSNLAIITSPNSKQEIQTLVNDHRE
jgi:DNA-binding response OmpR family regulator